MSFTHLHSQLHLPFSHLIILPSFPEIHANVTVLPLTLTKLDESSSEADTDALEPLPVELVNFNISLLASLVRGQPVK